MKRITAIILLVCHINVFMFLPHVAETDQFTKSGKRLDDINSLLEYLQVYLGNDKTADDEDNDETQNLHITSTIEYCYAPQYVLVEHQKVTLPKGKQHFKEYTSKKPSSIALDIQVPPPKA